MERGKARKCPINHLSVLTQLKSRKCKEQPGTFPVILHITRAIRPAERKGRPHLQLGKARLLESVPLH